MDHGGHEGHDMPMARCKMNMLWNTDIIDTCIVFRSWHVRSTTAFVYSCLAIVALGVLYEYLRVYQRKLDQHIALSLSKSSAVARQKGRGRSNSPGRGGGPSSGARSASASPEGTPVPPVSRALRAIVYGATVFLSFFLMLVFMTYNAYLIAATVIGASLGHYIFGATLNIDAILADSNGGKGMACH